MAVGELELAQNSRDMGLDGLCRDVQASCDLFVLVAAGDLAQHLLLAGSELVEFRILLDGQRL